MSGKVIEEIRKYPNQWVALSQDRSRVVAASRSLPRAMEKAREAGEANPLMMKAPSKAGGFVL